MRIKKFRISVIFLVCSFVVVIYLMKHSERESPRCCVERKKSCLACKQSMTEEEFCLLHFGLYDCPQLSEVQEDITLQTGEKNYRVMIAIDVLPQTGYTQFTATVLREYLDISPYDVCLFSSNTQDYERNIDDWTSWYGKGVTVFDTGADGSTIPVLEYFLKSEYNVLLLLQSDMVLEKDWINFVKDNLHRTNGLLSIYRAAHNYGLGYVEKDWLSYTCPNFHEGLCEGEDEFQTFGAVLTKNIARILVGNKVQLSDTGFKMASQAHDFKLFYSPNSLAIHISQSNQTNENCGNNEAPHKFNRCVLPEWIQSGIEFYFDRCTNPDELFSLEKFKSNESMGERFWARPAISFSLYGKSSRYTTLALLNANRMSSVYAGWKMWIYHDNTVDQQLLSELCRFNVRFINMAGSEIKNGMSWRFLVASEPVHIYAVRDIDSWILKRGKAAVDEWLSSGKMFHIMRDSPMHSSHAINGGMWGGRHEAVPHMKDLLLEKGLDNAYMKDMTFLGDVIWPIAKRSYWAHDSHPDRRWGDVHPFPSEIEDPRFFVGSVN